MERRRGGKVDSLDCMGDVVEYTWLARLLVWVYLLHGWLDPREDCFVKDNYTVFDKAI